ETSLAIPAFLASHGLRPIIAPLRTTTGQLSFRLDPYTLALYPFVAGVDGYAAELSQPQWVELGVAVKRLHTLRLPPAIRRALTRETYAPRYRHSVLAFQARRRGSRFADPLTAELAAFLASKGSEVRQLVDGAERLARAL